MAICGFRAENYPFGLLEADGLRRILAVLERAARGFPAADLSRDRAGAIEALLRAGLIVVRDERVLLAPGGAGLLTALRELLAPRREQCAADRARNGSRS